MGPVCTIMVGRLDDWLKAQAELENITIDPGYLELGGVAVFKKTYKIFRQRGYRIPLLSAAFRNHMQWSEFIDGDVVISPPYKWQVRFNASDVEVVSRIDSAVNPEILDMLLRNFPIPSVLTQKVAFHSMSSTHSPQPGGPFVNSSRLVMISRRSSVIGCFQAHIRNKFG